MKPFKSFKHTLLFWGLLAVPAMGFKPAYGEEGLVLSHPPVLTLEVARSGMTRLEIEGDMIDDVMVFPREAQECLFVHPKGQLFITGDGLKGPVTLTLMTASGLSQDVHVRLVSREAAPLVLKSGLKADPAVPKPWVSDDLTSRIPLSSRFKKWIRVLENHQTPEGFREVFEDGVGSRARGGVSASLAHILQNTSHRILCFDVKGEPGALLDPVSWMCGGDSASVFSHPKIPEEGKTRLFILQPLKEISPCLP